MGTPADTGLVVGARVGAGIGEGEAELTGIPLVVSSGVGSSLGIADGRPLTLGTEDGLLLTLGVEDGLLLTVGMIDVVGAGIGAGDRFTGKQPHGAVNSTTTVHSGSSTKPKRAARSNSPHVVVGLKFGISRWT